MFFREAIGNTPACSEATKQPMVESFVQVESPKTFWKFSKYTLTTSHSFMLLYHLKKTYEVKTGMSEEDRLCPVRQFLFEFNPSRGSGARVP